MPRILLDEGALNSRGIRIREILAQLAGSRGGPAWEVLPGPQGSLAIGTFDGTRTSRSPRDLRFLTSVDGLRANYYEIWNRIPTAPTEFYLSQAYLTIYQRKDRFNEPELLALHCDPNEPDGDSAEYKRGPHLHIEAADHPIPRAHIALTGGHLDDVLSDVATLTEAFDWCIKMICHEILSLYLPGSQG